MADNLRRAGLAVLAFGCGMVGFWAAFAPRSFYNSFPGGGRHWVSVDGPFNEHLVRDFGQWNLAGLFLLVVALIVLDARLVRLVAIAYLIVAVLHIAYHAGHLDIYSTSDKVANMFALIGGAVIAAALVVSPGDRRT